MYPSIFVKKKKYIHFKKIHRFKFYKNFRKYNLRFKNFKNQRVTQLKHYGKILRFKKKLLLRRRKLFLKKKKKFLNTNQAFRVKPKALVVGRGSELGGKYRNFTLSSILKYKNYDFGDRSFSYFFLKIDNIYSYTRTFYLYLPKLLFNNYTPGDLYFKTNNNISHYYKSSLDLVWGLSVNTGVFFIHKKKTHPINGVFFIRDKVQSYLAYMGEWCFLLLHNYFLKNKNKRRLLGLYPTSKAYFFSNDIFFPSLLNVVIFHKSMRISSRRLTNLVISPCFSTTIPHKVKRSLPLKFKNTTVLRGLVFKKFHNFVKFGRLPRLKGGIKKRKRFRYSVKKRFFKFKKIIKNMFFRKKFKKKEYFFHRRRRIFFKELNFIDFIHKPLQIVALNKYSGRVKFKKNLFHNYLGKNYQKYSHCSFYKSFLNLNLSHFFLKKIASLFLVFQENLLLKFFIFNQYNNYNLGKSPLFFNNYTNFFFKNTNLIPTNSFSYKLKKTLVLSRLNFYIKENIVPWTYNTVIRFIEFCSGRKAILQVYSFMNQSIDLDYILLYKRWIPRFFYFERRLGHRFFLEEALHIIHMGFNLHDIKMLSTWLKAMITRISFWKTRLIFRFIKYIFNNYFFFLFSQVGIKGFKVKLKGKISVAGNSRKRTILYRVGKTSHSSCNLKVIHNFSTIVTFTGVMGLQVWIFF